MVDALSNYLPWVGSGYRYLNFKRSSYEVRAGITFLKFLGRRWGWVLKKRKCGGCINIYIWGAIPGSKIDTCLNTREEPVNSYFLLKETLAAILAV